MKRSNIGLTRRTALISGAAIAVARQLPVLAEATPDENGWATMAPLIPARSEFAAAVLDGQIYVAGGFGATHRFDRYDPATNAWTNLADLPAGRHHLGVAALDGQVYVVGGHDEEMNSATDTVWRYDPASNQWSDIEPLPQGPRGALGVAVLDGQLYAVGGSSHDLGGPATGDVSCFDPASGEWRLKAPLQIPREHLAVAAASNGIVAAGGRNGSDEALEMAQATEFYDAENDRWEMRSPLPVPRAGLGGASDGAMMIVLGGERMPDTFDAVNHYDPATDRWSDLTPLPEARHGVAVAILDGWLYAISGSTLAGQVQNIETVSRIALTRS